MIEEFEGLTEIISKRGYSNKSYDMGGNKTKHMISAGHIHYKDGNEFKDIDTRLIFDDINRVYKHDKASYSCEIPEYSDGEILFKTKFEGADFGCRFKSGSDHVVGSYVEDEINGHYILYKDAFGTGIDFRVYSCWFGILKVIVANQKPTIQQLKKFNYELIINNEDIYIGDVVWDKNSAVNFKGNMLKIKNNDKYIYINPAIIEDSKGFTAMLDIVISKTGNKLMIEKQVGIDIPINDLVYPVYLRL